MSEESGSFTTWLERAKDPAYEKYQEVWDHIAERVGALLFKLATQHGLRGDSALDLSQEVLVKLVMVIGQFDRRKGQGRAWVRTIARNILYTDFRRLRSSRPAHLSEEEQRQILDSLAGPDALTESAAARELETAERDLRRERPRTFAVYDLSYRQGLSVKEVAARLGLATGTVYNERSSALTFLSGRLLDKESA